MNDIDRLVAGIAADPGPGMTPGARELFDEITTDPGPSARPARAPALAVRGADRRRTRRRDHGR